VGVLEGGERSSLVMSNMAHLVDEIFRHRAGDMCVPSWSPRGAAAVSEKTASLRTRGFMRVVWVRPIAFLNAPQAMVAERGRMQVVAVAQEKRLGAVGEIAKRCHPSRPEALVAPRKALVDCDCPTPVRGPPPAPSACMSRIRFVGK
jgi:hypothetical protein